MRIVGITGRSGSGKTAVAAHIAAQGYPCVDGDAVSRTLLQPGAPGYPALLGRLQNAFGCDIVDDGGALRRRLLADRAFATPEGTQALNAIMHPAILQAVLEQAARAQAAGAKLFFLDGAAIVGTVFAAHCDVIAVVTAPYAASMARIMARDGLSAEQAARRLAAQRPEAELVAAADYVLPNDGSLPDLYRRTDAMLAALTAAPRL